jgi:hypothetical protein
MKKIILPSIAQAKRLAGLFSGDFFRASSFLSPTDRTILKHGWVSATGETGTFPNRAEFLIHKINADGLRALEQFLYENRTRLP